MEKSKIINKEFYSKLPSDKIKINWNKDPVKMDLFLSFLKVEVVRSKDHFGSDTGWTLLKNDNIRLIIGGGIVSGVEYLDTIKFGEKLSNPYNNYVNPFYLFDIFTCEGIIFFIEYYNDDIQFLLESHMDKIKTYKDRLESQNNIYNEILNKNAKRKEVRKGDRFAQGQDSSIGPAIY